MNLTLTGKNGKSIIWKQREFVTYSMAQFEVLPMPENHIVNVNEPNYHIEHFITFDGNVKVIDLLNNKDEAGKLQLYLIENMILFNFENMPLHL